jgi:hypothetical protein
MNPQIKKIAGKENTWIIEKKEISLLTKSGPQEGIYK